MLTLAVLLAAVASDATPTEGPPRNLLVIVTDEHNFRTLGCYRDTLPREQAEVWGLGAVVETPNLDRLAREGAIATRAYATSPVCTPCRASLWTGLYPQFTGSPANDLPLRDDVPTLGRLLQEAGYITGYAGKWHLNGRGKPEWNPERNVGWSDQRYLFNRGHWKKLEVTPDGRGRVAARDRKGGPSYALDGADSESFTTDFLTDRALDFLAAHADEPFAYVLSLPDPHGPNTVRSPYDTAYATLPLTPPPTFGKATHPKWAPPQHGLTFKPGVMAKYFGMVRCIDDNVGRLLDDLQRRGVLDRTLVVMTSDHGDLCYEHDRTNKGNPYEASARIPFLMRLPPAIPAGTVVTQPIGSVDATPTWLSLLGVHPSDYEPHGSDRSAWFRGATQTADDAHAATVVLRSAGAETPPGGDVRGNDWLAVLDQRHKLIVSARDRPWLFDAARDPMELTNQLDATDDTTRDAAARLAAALLAYDREFGDSRFRMPGVRKQLESLASAP